MKALAFLLSLRVALAAGTGEGAGPAPTNGARSSASAPAPHPRLAMERHLTLAPGPGNRRNSEGDLVALKDGRWLLVYTHFTGGADDHSSAFLAARESSDGGRTWGEKDTVVVPNEGGCNVMSVSLLRLCSGDLALFYLRKNSLQDCRPLMRRSRDEGKTWSAATECITDQVGYYVLNNSRVIQLAGGRLVLPTARHDFVAGRLQPGKIVVYVSDDLGATWRRSRSVLDQDARGSRMNFMEPGVVEVTTNRMLMLIRTKVGCQYLSESHDQGETWTAPQPSELFSPEAPATIARIPGTSDLLVVWNDHCREPEQRRRAQPPLRTPLAAALSRDGGKTWVNHQLLEDAPDHGYCYTAVRFAGDRVLLAYCAHRSRYGLETTQVSSFRVRDLYSPSAALDAIRNGRGFLAGLIDPELDLLPEYRGADVYWLYHDNYLAAKVLAATHPEIARRIESAMQREGVRKSGKIELLFEPARNPVPFRQFELREVRQAGAKRIRTEAVTDRLLAGWEQYADLLLFAALSEPDPAAAAAHWQAALRLWDGRGFFDPATRQLGRYSTYKLALALVAASRLPARPELPYGLVERLLALQAQSGGWITDYSASGERIGQANVETTCLAIVGLEAARQRGGLEAELPATARAALPAFRYQGVVLESAQLKYRPHDDVIYPAVVRAGGRITNAPGKLFLYYAPHDAPGGICLAFADQPEGPWREHPQNPVIAREWPPHYRVSHVSGPDVIWSEEESRFFLYFHGENPVTRLATSKDGVHFEYEGEVISTRMFPQLSEASYGRVFRHPLPGHDNRYVMLLMGNDRGTRRIYLAWSKDGRRWETRPTPLLHPPPGTDQVAGAVLLTRAGRHYLVAHANDSKADFNQGFDLYLAETDPAMESCRHLGKFMDHTFAGRDNPAVMSPCFLEDAGRLCLFFNVGPRLRNKIALATESAP